MKWIAGITFLIGTVMASTTSVAKDRKLTFVLVHGALFTSAGWTRTQSLLQEAGHNVVTIDVPGRPWDGLDPKSIDISRAAAKVCQVVRLQENDVILVGHSQGGALISQAHSNCDKQVRALVYVAAVAPLDGEIAFAALNPDRDTGFGKCATPDPEAGLFRLNKKGPLAELFFQDVKDNEKTDIVATMVSEPMGIGTTPLKIDMEKYRGVAKYYVEATEDRIVTIETQREIQKRIGWERTYSIRTGHCPFLSKPLEFSKILTEIARLVEQGR